MNKEWFFEELYPSSKIGYQINKTLYERKTPFQEIKVFENPLMGRVLALDKIIQTTEEDEFIYHEMLAHIPLLTHPEPQNVLIIGGGDGGILREVLKHPIKKVTLVEIDKEVTDIAKSYLKSICRNSFRNKKLELVIDDGAKFVQNTKEDFDVVIIDSSDPVGPARVLFKKKFYQGIKNILNKRGIMVRQTGSSFYQKEEMRKNFKIAKEIFKYTFLYLIALPSYIGGFFSLLYCSRDIFPFKISKSLLEKKINSLKLKTKYYNPDIHRGCFILPEYIKKDLGI